MVVPKREGMGIATPSFATRTFRFTFCCYKISPKTNKVKHAIELWMKKERDVYLYHRDFILGERYLLLPFLFNRVNAEDTF